MLPLVPAFYLLSSAQRASCLTLGAVFTGFVQKQVAWVAFALVLRLAEVGKVKNYSEEEQRGSKMPMHVHREEGWKLRVWCHVLGCSTRPGGPHSSGH